MRTAFALEESTSRATLQGSFHSGFLTSTPHEAMNAGHALRRSSLSQPGSALNAAGRKSCLGASAAVTVVGREEDSDDWSVETVVHAAKASTVTADASKLRHVNDIEGSEMWWVFVLEAGVALFLLVFIVWWTMFSGRKPSSSTPPKKDDTQA